MSEPSDPMLYAAVKREIWKKHPKNSAYRSGLLVQQYKARGGTYKKKSSGDKRRNSSSLKRWFKEKWRNQRGGVGYERAGDVYRPTVVVSRKKTPTTFSELSRSEVKRASREKKRKGRVSRFAKG